MKKLHTIKTAFKRYCHK